MSAHSVERGLCGLLLILDMSSDPTCTWTLPRRWDAHRRVSPPFHPKRHRTLPSTTTPPCLPTPFSCFLDAIIATWCWHISGAFPKPPVVAARVTRGERSASYMPSHRHRPRTLTAMSRSHGCLTRPSLVHTLSQLSILSFPMTR
jgi:hypothetical protein